MSRFACLKTAQIGAEPMAKGERSNVATSQCFRSIGCSLTFYYQWKSKFAAKPQTFPLLRVLALRAHQGLDRDQTPRSRR